jgi:hypothetical protein
MGWTVYNSDGKILQSAELGDNAVTSAKIADGAIVAADINASAAIEFSQMENLTAGRALVTDGNGDILVSGVTTTELELLDGLTSSTTELNLLDGVSGLVQADLTKLAAIDATAAEIDLLDGVSGLVQADFTKLAAVDSSAAELNKLDGASANVTAANLNALTGSGATALHSHAGGGSLDTALTSFVSDGDYRSVYMLGAWPQSFAGTTDGNVTGSGFAVDKNGANSGIYSSTNGGGYNFTSGDSDQHSCALFAGEARLRASDDFTITCRFDKESASLFSFGMAADVQGYRPESQNDAIAFYFGAGNEVTCITDNSGTDNEETVTANGISGEHYATIIVSGNGTSVAFWLDGVLKTTHTTNIPTATDLYLFMTTSSYTNGTYRRCIVMDFFAYREV